MKMKLPITLSPADQRKFLIAYVNADHVINRQDPFQRKFDRLVGDCLVAEELELGVALVSLVAARGVGLHAVAAGRLMSLLADREGRKCRSCGCTDADRSGCVARTGRPCAWVEDDLCSACVPTEMEGGGR